MAACIDYFRKNRDRMRYDEYISRGIQAGSGVVESPGRQIVGKRLKQPGSHWTKIGANHLLAIKSCLQNNRWADFLDWKANLAVATWTTEMTYTRREGRIPVTQVVTPLEPRPSLRHHLPPTSTVIGPVDAEPRIVAALPSSHHP